MYDRAPIDEAYRTGHNRPNRAPRRPDNRLIEIPIDHHPGTVQGEGPSAGSARLAMSRIYGSWERIREAAADRRVPNDRLAKAAQQALDGALKTADESLKIITAQVRHIESEITARVRPRQDPTLAAEVRAYWRKEGFGERLTAAVRADPRTASAILTAPAYLSGLSDEQRDAVEGMAIEAHAPEQREALDEARRAWDKVSAAGGRMLGLVGPRIQQWREPESSAINELEKRRD